VRMSFGVVAGRRSRRYLGMTAAIPQVSPRLWQTFLSPDSPQDIASPFPSQSLLSPYFLVCITVQNCCKDNKNNPFEQVSIVKSAEMCLFCLRLSRFEVNIGRDFSEWRL